MKSKENSEKIIKVLKSHGRKTLKAIIFKTSLSKLTVVSELKQLVKNNLVMIFEKFGLITYKLNKNKYNCHWSDSFSGSGFWLCIHPNRYVIDKEIPCKNDRNCSGHNFSSQLGN